MAAKHTKADDNRPSRPVDQQPVHGYEKSELALAHTTFQPVSADKNGFGPGSLGRSDEKGRFELPTVWPDAPGTVPGEHRVTISYEDSTQQPRNVVLPQEYIEGEATFQVPEKRTDKALIAIVSKK